METGRRDAAPLRPSICQRARINSAGASSTATSGHGGVVSLQFTIEAFGEPVAGFIMIHDYFEAISLTSSVNF
ncbi:MAG: hypothetical protein L0154_18450 [Chloroflexi bacterium]|nr:hypothetical protein [Chloroflexota bacterium]